MNNRIQVIRPALIDNYIRIIRNLAQRGRNSYQDFFIQPLSNWSKSAPVEPMDKLLTLIDNAENKKSAQLSFLYKMAIIRSVAPDQFNLSLTGNISINFLKQMREKPVSVSDEAIEFVNILRPPFRDYSEKEFIRMNKKFEDEISTADSVEVEKLIDIREVRDKENTLMKELSERAVDEIKIKSRQISVVETKRHLIAYLLKFSDPAAPDRHIPVYKLFHEIEYNNPGIEKDVLDSTAVIIYHEILNSIKKGDLTKAVKYISKYTVLFRGNPNTPNYEEVDSFEKKFFEIIEKRNLWDKI